MIDLHQVKARHCRDRILAALAEQPRSRDELAELVHCSPRNVQRYLQAMLAQSPRWVHIVDWRRGECGMPPPVYALGEGRDKPRPRPYTPGQKARRYRKANPEYCLVRAARRRAKSAAAKAPRREAMIAAFFGPAAAATGAAASPGGVAC